MIGGVTGGAIWGGVSWLVRAAVPTDAKEAAMVEYDAAQSSVSGKTSIPSKRPTRSNDELTSGIKSAERMGNGRHRGLTGTVPSAMCAPGVDVDE